MTVLALRAQDVGTEPGAQRLGHGNRAVGLLVLLDDGGQQAAGGQAGGVEGVDVGGSVGENLITRKRNAAWTVQAGLPLIDAEDAQPVVGPEILVILETQGRKRQVVGEAARRNPHVVYWPRSATQCRCG